MRMTFVAAAAALLLACGDSNAPRTIDGSYTLRTLRNQSLPVPVAATTPTYSLYITSGSLGINGDGSFNASYTFLKYNNGVSSTETISCAGTWAPSGQYIQMQEVALPGCGDAAIAELHGGNRLTVVWNELGTAELIRSRDVWPFGASR